MNPEDLHYTQSHEWVRIDSGTGTIGITDHAQKELGEIVYLELPQVGQVNAEPASASSTELSPTSYTRWWRPISPLEPMYIAGRRRTASMPSSTFMSSAV